MRSWEKRFHNIDCLFLNTVGAKQTRKEEHRAHTMLRKPKLVLRGNKGQKNRKLYWQTDKAHLDQGLLSRSLEQFSEGNSPSCSALTHTSLHSGWLWPARAEQSLVTVTVSLLQYSWEQLFPQGREGRPHSVVECSPKGSKASCVLQLQGRAGPLVLLAFIWSFRLSPKVCAMRCSHNAARTAGNCFFISHPVTTVYDRESDPWPNSSAFCIYATM